MFKVLIIAAIVACANGYYNHGAVGSAGYYGNYGQAVAAALPAGLNAHHGNIYNHGYGHIGAIASQPKIIPATYPGAVHNKGSNYAVAGPTGYVGAEYSHGSVSHPGPAYVHAPAAIAAHAPTIAFNHGPATTYAHSHYAVNEGATNYAAHSRYAIAAAPAALAYGHHSQYPIASASPIYHHGLPVDHRLQKIAYNPAISHMGYPNHAAPSYSW